VKEAEAVAFCVEGFDARLAGPHMTNEVAAVVDSGL
jgi:hypothetical protein